MEKRVIVAVVLSFVVLYVYQAMFAPPPPAPRPKAAQTELAAGAAAAGAGQSVAPSGQPSLPSGQPSSPGSYGSADSAAAVVPAAAIEVAATEARDIVIETDAVRAVFTNRGAALTSWRLNRYKDRAGHPVDLVPQTLPDAAETLPHRGRQQRRRRARQRGPVPVWPAAAPSQRRGDGHVPARLRVPREPAA